MSAAPVCIVLGGSGAVGSDVRRALEERGARVGYTYFRSEARSNHGSSKKVDLRDVAAIDRVVAEFASHFGRIDALVNCAAVAVTAPFEGKTVHHTMGDVDEPAWDAMLALNTKASFFAVRSALPRMREAGGGNVVLLGSIDGVKSAPSPVHYAASKGALAGMIKAMAKELGPDNVRVNSVAPGLLERGISSLLPDDLRAEYLKHCGLKRVGRVEEVAHLVAWLATENTFVTGQTIVVDGAL
jgi:3-oxoacyl-[acyl-carrier protein] reductase